MRDLSRLLAPDHIAVIGGGAWCAAIIGAAKAIGFAGRITPIHPSKQTIAGLDTAPSVAEVDTPIDAAFIGVNRNATLQIVTELRGANAGGAICFASGFSEAMAEDASGADLQAQLVERAGDMPVLGPNCYGFLNGFDQAGIWPDQHGMQPVERGVAILTQSSNIAINLTMQARGLPIGMMITCGNQAQTRQADLALHLLDDPRVTAIGLHIEGFGDLAPWERLAQAAHRKNIPLIALKSGKSEQAQAATISHTASMAGGDAGAQALLDRLGIARVDSLPVFLEALKLAHSGGALPRGTIGSISCSGGEASLSADTAANTSLEFPPLNAQQRQNLGDALGPMVALANPLDYHTYIWRDEAAMTRAWAALADDAIDLILIILDYPRADRCDPQDWDIATRAAIAAAHRTGKRYAVVASLPELLPEATAAQLMAQGITPFHGLDHAMAALDALSNINPPHHTPVLDPGPEREATALTEAHAKAELSDHGLRIPQSTTCNTRDQAAAEAEGFGTPVALKVLGLAHKTGAGGIALNLSTREDVMGADLTDGPLLVEEMVTGTLAELLIGVTRDPAHGFVLTLAAGGTLTEILQDSQQLLIPASRDQVEQALMALRTAPLLHGYRGSPPAAIAPILDAVDAVQSYVIANANTVEEVEVNPLLCTPTDAIAVDALIRKAPDHD